MSRSVEIPDDLPADWPDHWTGSTRIDCGAQGSFATTLSVSGHPNTIHVANFRQIVERWPEVWPKICQTLTETLACPHPIRCPGAVLRMKLPSAPVSDGAEWYVRVEFYNQPGAWVVWFDGWKVNLETSGYGYNA